MFHAGRSVGAPVATIAPARTPAPCFSVAFDTGRKTTAVMLSRLGFPWAFFLRLRGRGSGACHAWYARSRAPLAVSTRRLGGLARRFVGAAFFRPIFEAFESAFLYCFFTALTTFFIGPFGTDGR